MKYSVTKINYHSFMTWKYSFLFAFYVFLASCGGDDGNWKAIKISAGYSHTCAITTEGKIKCWGSNYAGQLGDGTIDEKHIPVNVSGLSENVIDVSAGTDITCALTEKGGVKCWGENSYGSLGIGNDSGPQLCSPNSNDKIPCSTSPQNVTNLRSEVKAISSGYSHICVVFNEGALQCWGSNHSGQLGTEDNLRKDIPTAVSGLSKDVSAVSCGFQHTCALLISGQVKCWGKNEEGELGNGTNENSNVPKDVKGLSKPITQICTGSTMSCALDDGGAVWCWGNGNNSTYIVPGLESDVLQIACGDNHQCVLTESGGVQCWGYNSSSQLGTGSDQYYVSIPSPVGRLSSGVAAISLGSHHSCALKNNGSVFCWGSNENGETGIGIEDYEIDLPSLVKGTE
ncbi:MAG: hypothetical protein PHE84_12495 [bacterium]|nr:hypothetical protein [bacterium]